MSENGPEGLKKGKDEDGKGIGLREIGSLDTVMDGCRNKV